MDFLFTIREAEKKLKLLSGLLDDYKDEDVEYITNKDISDVFDMDEQLEKICRDLRLI